MDRPHHERPDGRGYPELLSVEDLPLPPRIMAVANAYWAIRADRHYRPAVPAGEVTRMLQAGAGTQFDVAVVEAMPRGLRALVALALEDAAAS